MEEVKIVFKEKEEHVGTITTIRSGQTFEKDIYLFSEEQINVIEEYKSENKEEVVCLSEE